MKHSWANVVLLFLLIFQLLSGFAGLVNGTPGLGWILRLHDIGGFALVLVLLWKGAIIFDAFYRIRRINWSRVAFIVQTALLLVILLTGLVWPVTGYFAISGFSLMTIHAVSALAVVGLLLWHVLARRYVFKSPTLESRRLFIQTAALGIAGLAVWQLSEVAEAAMGLAGSLRRFSGSYEMGSRSGVLPVVTWLHDYPEPVQAEEWNLLIDGSVEHPFVLGAEEVDRLATDTLIATIDCTGGWYSSQEWKGVKLGRLLDAAGVRPEAASISIRAVSGYDRRFDIELARSFLLATHVEGLRLDHGHGFPIRLVAPGFRGFNWVKWVTQIHLNETSGILESPVPLQ